MSNKFLILATIFVSILQVKLVRIDPSRVLWAVNSGNEQGFQDSKGIKYQPDGGFSSSKISDYRLHPELGKINIKYTHDNEIYQIERTQSHDFSYKIPIQKEGQYVLMFKFCEMWFTEVNKRKISVQLGDIIVINELDIVKEVGPYAAWDVYVPVELRDNKLFYKGKECEGAFNAQELTVVFKKTKFDNPIVNSVALFEGTLQQTDEVEMTAFRKNWQRQDMEEQKAQAEIMRRKALKKQQNLLQDDFKVQNESYFSGVQRILAQPEGMVLMAVLFSYLFLLIVIGGDEENVSVQSKVFF